MCVRCVYLKKTVILAGEADLFDDFSAPRIIKTVEIDERNGVIGGLNDLVKIGTIMFRSDKLGRNMGRTRYKVGCQ